MTKSSPAHRSKGVVWILRDFIGICEKEGQLKRITTEVDWDLELSHVSKVVEGRGGPALLFENVKGYASPVSPVPSRPRGDLACFLRRMRICPW